MTTEIIKGTIIALITAFVIFIASAIYNAVSHGGLIRLLGGISREELRAGITVSIHQPGSIDVMGRDLLTAPGGSIKNDNTVHVQPSGSVPIQKWVLQTDEKP
jgi:hypothetical protein